MTGETIEYQFRDCSMNGHLVRPDAPNGAAVLIFPDGFGLGTPAKRRARMLADLGYLAFVADPYGGGRRARDIPEGHALSGALAADPMLLRGRAVAALQTLSALHGAAGRIAAIGYCFGGTCALELARTGADLAALVCFHGVLSTGLPAAAGSIRPSLLVCTGAADPLVPPDQILAFAAEMTAAGADWQVALYGGVKHNFTNPDAGTLNIDRVAYDADADRRSWQAMRTLFTEKL